MSERFASGWLSLREPVDHRSRPDALLGPLREAWTARGWRAITDLGSGTGSNLRYLAPRLPGPQRWTLVDHDEALLADARARWDGAREDGGDGDPVEIRTRVVDLAGTGVDAAAGADLVTASALLDLVSEPWLRRLVESCVRDGSGVLFALTYDGAIDWPGAHHPHDERVRQAVNAHQRTDKGLGRALGPAAAPVAHRLFREAGYRTWLVPTPWRLGPRDRALGEELLQGWFDAATAMVEDDEGALGDWARLRRETVAEAGVTVGHLDLLALP